MTRGERKAAHRWMFLIVLGLVGMLGLVFAKLVKLHVIEPNMPGYEAKDYHANMPETLGLRGRILDRNGVVLAESLPGREVYIDQLDKRLEKLPPERRAQNPFEGGGLL